MEKNLDFFMLTILKDKNLFANIYDKEEELIKNIRFYGKKYPIRLFQLNKIKGLSFDVAVIKKEDKLSAAIGPQKPIPDNATNIIKCKKKEIDIKKFLES